MVNFVRFPFLLVHDLIWSDPSVGELSNLQYLLYLNFAGGRSFKNLSAWPVMPWVRKNLFVLSQCYILPAKQHGDKYRDFNLVSGDKGLFILNIRPR